MTAPNLLALTTTELKLAILELGTSAADVIPAVTTDHVLELNSVFVTNIHASVVALVTVILKRGGTDYVLSNSARVPVKQIPVNVIAAGRTIYMEEGDSLRAYANAASNAIVYVPYTDMT